MAWLGLIALVGIVACCLDALLEALGSRRDRIRQAQGHPARARSRRAFSRLVPVGVVVVALVGVLVLALAGSGGGSSTGSTQSTTTNRSANHERTPGQVRVAVLNASHVANAASTEGIALRSAGYVVVDVGNAKVRTGRAVQCAPGFEREARTLAKLLGQGATVEAFPRTTTPSAAADCLVVLGS